MSSTSQSTNSAPTASQLTPPTNDGGASSDATLYLSLRLQALEALILGNLSSSSATTLNSDSSRAAILRRTLEARTSLDALIEPHKPIRSFVADYERNKALLIPSLPTSSSSSVAPSASSSQAFEISAPSSSGNVRGLAMLPTEKAALLLEAHTELKDFERQLSECQILDGRGVAAAGRLEEHYALAPELTLRADEANDLRVRHDSLEEAVITQLDRYSQLVDTISELYVEWDQVLTSVERRLTILERAKRAREGEDAEE